MTVKLVVKENAIELELVSRVVDMGGRADKVQVAGRRGYFDRLVLLPGGRIFFVEIKRPQGGRFTEHQREYARAYTALGAAVAVVKNSADIDRLLKS